MLSEVLMASCRIIYTVVWETKKSLLKIINLWEPIKGAGQSQVAFSIQNGNCLHMIYNYYHLNLKMIFLKFRITYFVAELVILKASDVIKFYMYNAFINELQVLFSLSLSLSVCLSLSLQVTNSYVYLLSSSSLFLENWCFIDF